MPDDSELNWNQPPAADMSRWRRGRTYHIIFLIPEMHKVPREMVARFLEGSSTRLIFSGRPAFGTAELAPGHIISWQRVDDVAMLYQPRKVDQ